MTNTQKNKHYNTYEIAGRYSGLLGWLQLILLPVWVWSFIDQGGHEEHYGEMYLITYVVVQLATAYIFITKGKVLEKGTKRLGSSIKKDIHWLGAATVISAASALKLQGLSLLYMGLLVVLARAYFKVGEQRDK